MEVHVFNMLSPLEIRRFYENGSLNIPSVWNLSRKHFRIETASNHFVKLTHFENRLNQKELKKYLYAYAPLHVYFSVLNWLFPECVGKKYKANYAIPIGGEYVVDVDWYLAHDFHKHLTSPSWKICPYCIELSKYLTIQACEAIGWCYRKIAIVFSGKRGFHIHVLDFDWRDWTHYNEKNPIKTHESARYKFSQVISLQTWAYDRAHFILSTDPMRILSVPSSINGETGLVCSYIGRRKDLERQKIGTILAISKPIRELYGYPEPEEGDEMPRIKQGGGNIARVTVMTPQPKTHYIEKTLVE